MGSILCEHCTAACCRYIALPIDTPSTRRDFDDIRWYVMHEGISVFVEEGDWFLQVATPCTNLLPDNRCGIYEDRPGICREYEAGECDYTGGTYEYDLLLTSLEEVELYAAKKLGRKNPFGDAARREVNGLERNGARRPTTQLRVLLGRR